MSNSSIVLCPGQGAQASGMGAAWREGSPAAAQVFAAADAIIDFTHLGGSLSSICFGGAAEVVNRTDVSQPALFACGIASLAALQATGEIAQIECSAGLSLGEYTALHIAGAFSFEDGLKLVAQRGRFMQEAAEASRGGMVALIGADESQAQQVCDTAAQGDVLVCANFNAPGQIVLSGAAAACDRALEAASAAGCRATRLQVAGAFHSPLMQPAADRMAQVLESVALHPLKHDVWSNVTAATHARNDPATLRKLLVQQIVSPVRWSQSMAALGASLQGRNPRPAFHELAPGSVLKGLMRRIDKSCEITSHDKPDKPDKPAKQVEPAQPA